MPSGSVYASVDAVQVPAGIEPGGHFTARVWGTAKGQRVAKVKHFWRASGNAPCNAREEAAAAEGPRHQHRPSAVARRVSGTARAQAIDNLQFQRCSISQWQSAVELPFELNAEDVGWLAGPVNGSAGRDMPPFTGATSGPRDPELTSRASARRIMRSVQFSRSFKQQVIQLAREHQQQWSAERTVSDGVERSFRAADLEPAHVELWFALAVRVAKINPAIPAQKLWDAEHHCFDTAVATACSFLQWEWLNRHLSFGAARQIDADGDGSDGSGSGSGSGSDSDADGGAATPARDRYRSRRLVSDIGRAQAAKAFNPGQHLGFDDLIRVTRHREGRRVRHKAAVHTGRANDGLNDAQSHYFMWWEEQGWLRHRECVPR